MSLTHGSDLISVRQTDQVIISSHGGINYEADGLPKLPFNLHFMTHGNRTTKGKVSSVAFMSSSELTTEPKGTSNVQDHILTYYQADTWTQINEANRQGFDVVTIRSGNKVSLKSVLNALRLLNRYKDVYCLFCRVAVGHTYKKTVSSDVFAELKKKLAKK